MLFDGRRWALAVGLVTLLVAQVAMAVVVDVQNAALPTGRVGASAVWTGSRALVFGGFDGGYLDEIVSYDPVTDTLELLEATLPTGRAWAGAVWTGNFVYVFGGLSAAGALDEIVRYDPATGDVATLATSLPGPRWAAGVVWDLGGPPPLFPGPSGWVVGGCINGTCSARTDEIIKFTHDQGDIVVAVRDERLPTARSHMGATWDGARILVVGGRDGSGDLDEILEIDTAARTVTESALALPSPRARMTAAFDNGNTLYAFGGCSGDPCGSALSDIILYRRGVAELIVLDYAELPTARWGQAGVWESSFGAAVYLFGGEDAGARLPDVVRFRPDRSPPSTTITVDGTPGTHGWLVSDATVTITAVDDLSGVRSTSRSVDAGPYVAYTGPLDFDEDGSHTVSAFSDDRAGNVEGAHGVSVRVDTTPPTSSHEIEGTPGADGWWVGDPPTLSITAEDATSGVDRIEVSVDGGPFEAGAAEFVIDEEGIHTFAHRAIDEAGNVGDETSVVVAYDPTPPDVALTRPAPGSVISNDGELLEAPIEPAVVVAVPAAGSLTVEVDAADATSGVDRVLFVVDDLVQAIDREAPYAWVWDLAATGPGPHDLQVIAVDAAGNLATEGRDVVVVVVGPGPASTGDRADHGGDAAARPTV